MTDRRLASLQAALGFLQLPPRAPELRLLCRWLDTWAGKGPIDTVPHFTAMPCTFAVEALCSF